MKKLFKALGVLIKILGVLAFIFLVLALINLMNELKMFEYVDSFSAVENEDMLHPEIDENGICYFVTDGDFRVMQLTDIHIGGGFLSTAKDKKAINALAAMISAEKPDLVIVTGDMSFAVPYIAGTFNNAYAHRIFGRIMENLGVYWTVCFGNHDSEVYDYYDRAAVSEMYESEKLEHCLFTPDGDLSGEGNHRIDVRNSAGFITESFYMIDTHSYTDKDPLGILWDYDFVKEDQIDWYTDNVEGAKAYNEALYLELSDADKALYEDLLTPKSLMFMHIPLLEVKHAYDEYVNNGWQFDGYDGEDDPTVYSSRTDTELFEAVVELGSTQALFFGHDHLNNFVLEYKGVTLSYGYSIDYLAYSDIDGEGYQRGCTVITCSPSGEAEITHENYYQDKYPALYEKESVNMDKNEK